MATCHESTLLPCFYMFVLSCSCFCFVAFCFRRPGSRTVPVGFSGHCITLIVLVNDSRSSPGTSQWATSPFCFMLSTPPLSPSSPRHSLHFTLSRSPQSARFQCPQEKDFPQAPVGGFPLLGFHWFRHWGECHFFSTSVLACADWFCCLHAT